MLRIFRAAALPLPLGAAIHAQAGPILSIGPTAIDNRFPASETGAP
jgi:hypothetical protein